MSLDAPSAYEARMRGLKGEITSAHVSRGLVSRCTARRLSGLRPSQSYSTLTSSMARTHGRISVVLLRRRSSGGPPRHQLACKPPLSSVGVTQSEVIGKLV